MATILFTWELGGGFGHLMLIRPLAESLIKDGHRVAVAVRNFAGTATVLAIPGLEFHAAPVRNGAIRGHHNPPATFAQLLHNIGFGDQSELRVMVSAWRSLFRCVQPDLIVTEHSPTALLAAYSEPVRVAPLGIGFSCPAPHSPFPDWRPELGNNPSELANSEQKVLDNVNAVLEGAGSEPFSRLADLYSKVDDTLLVTYPELDPFGTRPGVSYLGSWPELPSAPPRWPPGDGPRIFAYLKAFRGLPTLLKLLSHFKLPTILRIEGVEEKLRQQFESPNLCWQEGFIDIDQVAHECDLAIVNATHVMTTSMLLTGTPLLMLPRFLEHRLTAERVVAIGAGLCVNPNDLRGSLPALKEMLTSTKYSEAAKRFSERYRDANRQDKLEEAVERLRSLLP